MNPHEDSSRIILIFKVFVLNEVKSGNWDRADMLKNWMNHGGILIMGYHMYRNLSQCVRIKNKRQKIIFQESLVDPGLFRLYNILSFPAIL